MTEPVALPRRHAEAEAAEFIGVEIAKIFSKSRKYGVDKFDELFEEIEKARRERGGEE